VGHTHNTGHFCAQDLDAEDGNDFVPIKIDMVGISVFWEFYVSESIRRINAEPLGLQLASQAYVTRSEDYEGKLPDVTLLMIQPLLPAVSLRMLLKAHTSKGSRMDPMLVLFHGIDMLRILTLLSNSRVVIRLSASIISSSAMRVKLLEPGVRSVRMDGWALELLCQILSKPST